jgi:hypothetical protein
MDLASRQSWFATQPERFKLLLLIEVMHELTIVLRDISTTGDKNLMWRSAWLISECNHRLLGNASAVLTRQPCYPDDVVVASCLTISIIKPSSPTRGMSGIGRWRPPPNLARAFCPS